MDPNFFAGTSFSPVLLLFIIPLTIATLYMMTRSQPLQTVLFAAVFIYIICSALFLLIHITRTRLTAPLSRHSMAEHLQTPLLWVLIVLNSRGVGKLILRRWRQTENYGFGLLGISTACATFAVMLWSSAVTWRNISITATGIAAMQLVCVPWLIEKRPTIPQRDYSPLVLWLALGLIPLFGRFAAKL